VNGGQTFGERADALSTAPPASPAVPRGGHGNVVVPRGGAISYVQQPHGSTSPTLSGVGGAIVTGKNTAVPLGPPAVMDADGDPVTLTTTAAMGDVEAGVYRPRAGYAGADAIRFTASDGYAGTASAEQPVTVSNATPVVLIDAQARSLLQGSSTRIGLAASDADPGDTLTWSLTSVPSSLAGRVAVTPAGELAVDLPPGLRSVSPLPIGVQVSDTTPQVAGTALGTLYVKVQPAYGPIGVTVATRSTGQTVQFSSVLEDADLEAAALVVRPAPRYLWIFGEGATPRTSSLPNPRVRFASGVVAAGYTLTVTVPRTEGESVTPAVSGRVALRPDGRSLLAVDQRVDRRRTRLVVSLRSRAAGTVQVALRIRGRRSLAGRARVTAGPSGTLGRRVDVSFDLRGVRARTADLVVTYADGLAGPSPTAVDASCACAEAARRVRATARRRRSGTSVHPSGTLARRPTVATGVIGAPAVERRVARQVALERPDPRHDLVGTGLDRRRDVGVLVVERHGEARFAVGVGAPARADRPRGSAGQAAELQPVLAAARAAGRADGHVDDPTRLRADDDLSGPSCDGPRPCRARPGRGRRRRSRRCEPRAGTRPRTPGRAAP
jgi:hypothetical protein